jgi:dsDNA-binding SOS-regulon protein
MKELKSLVEVGLLVEEMGNAPIDLLEEVDEALARQIAELRDWLAGALAKWKELPPEAKLEELAAFASWRSSKVNDGSEYVAADEAPELAKLLEEAGGRLEVGGYAYYLGRGGRWITRYPRGRRGAGPAAVGSGKGGEGR